MQSHRIIVYESMLAFLTYFLMPPKSSQSSRICFNLQKSIHHNMMESQEGKCSQRMLQRLLQIKLVFIPSPSPISMSLLLRPAPVPKQGTQHLVTDAFVLPCQLLVLPANLLQKSGIQGVKSTVSI